MEPLSRRLRLIFDMVHPGHPVADVGSDHGQLIAALVGGGRAPSGVATDIRPAPLQKTRDRIARLGLEDRVETVLCDGLSGVDGAAATEIVIAGMGGELIARIIESWLHSRESHRHFLLQPMTHPEALRAYLYANGYHIREERCVAEHGHVYSVLSVCHTGETTQPDDLDLYLGGVALQHDSAACAYKEKLCTRLLVKARGLERAGQDAARWRVLIARIRATL